MAFLTLPLSQQEWYLILSCYFSFSLCLCILSWPQASRIQPLSHPFLRPCCCDGKLRCAPAAMVGFRNPFSQPKDEPETSDADAALAAATEPPSPAPILVPEPVLAPLQDVEAAEHHVYTHTPTDKLTAHQFFYIFIIDGIGAMILSGGINFAIAYGIEHLPWSLSSIANLMQQCTQPKTPKDTPSASSNSPTHWPATQP